MCLYSHNIFYCRFLSRFCYQVLIVLLSGFDSAAIWL